MEGQKKKRRRKKKKQISTDYTFELVLSDGKSKKFRTGQEMYNWASSVRKNWDFPDTDHSTPAQTKTNKRDKKVKKN